MSTRRLRTREPQRRQGVIRFEIPEESLPPEHPARMLWRIVETLDMSAFLAKAKAVEGRQGRDRTSVHLLLTLWLYAIRIGIGSAREIERRQSTDLAFQWIVGDEHVGRSTLSEFRISHHEALSQLFTDVLGTLMHRGLVSLDVVAQDGTRVRASASAPSFRRESSRRTTRRLSSVGLRSSVLGTDEEAATTHPACRWRAQDGPGYANLYEVGGRRTMRIGIIGAGLIGTTMGELWVKAGHEVLLSSRHPEELAPLVARLGERARAGMPEEAAAFGEVILLAVPFGAAADLGVQLAPTLAGKVVLDAGNPLAGRDDVAAEEVARAGRGSGRWTAQHLPGARVVKAFNTVYFKTLAAAAHRPGDRVGIPLASDDREARETAVRLVTDAGFDPVVVGPLDRAQDFDRGTPVWNTGVSGRELRRRFGLD